MEVRVPLICKTLSNNYGELARYGDVEEILERIKGA